MSNSQICTCSHGWLVMLDLHPKSSTSCFLLNPISMEKIKLLLLPAPLISDVGFSPKYHYLHPNCASGRPRVCSRVLPTFWRTRHVDGAKKARWREQVFEHERPFTFSVVCGTKIYCLDRQHKNLREMCFDEDGRMEARPMLVQGEKSIEDAPYPYPLLVGNLWFMTHYLVESQSHLYLVLLFHGQRDENKIVDVWVYKLDFHDLEWTRVSDLGDHRVFFISIENSFSCSTITNVGSSSPSASAIATMNDNGDECVTENTIYIILLTEVGWTSLCVYDMEERTIATRLVCLNVIPNITRGYWVMPMPK